jgi:hypothetical protein
MERGERGGKDRGTYLGRMQEKKASMVIKVVV